jgi:hypothetical protein
MKHLLVAVGIVVYGFSLAGCGGQPASEPAVSQPQRLTHSSAQYVKGPNQGSLVPTAASLDLPRTADISPDATPDAVVSAFLEALRSGNDAQAAGLLTDKAYEETTSKDLAVQPPGAPSANYEVVHVELVGADGAHVSSTWTEVDDAGDTVTQEAVWIMRRQHNGWRVAGLATQVLENRPPLFLNFEDADDMIRKWNEAKAEVLAMQQEEEMRQASNPDATSIEALPR